MKGALVKRELNAAEKLSMDLNLSIFRIAKASGPGPQEKLRALEAVPGSDSFALAKLAIAAFNAADYDKADQYAQQLSPVPMGSEFSMAT